MSYDSLSLAEHHIYGSSRLGIQQYSDTAYLSVYKEGELLENALSTRQSWYSNTYNDWILPTATKPISTTGLLSRYTSDMRSLRILGYRQYELTDHLGNATATILDRRTGYGDAAGYYTGYHADLVSALDYYPFGMPMPGRSVDSYRFGFGGVEKDNEIKGEGNSLEYKFRVYDSRLGKFLSVDPLTKSYPYYTPYQFAGNSPIQFIDIEGKEPTYPDNFQTGITKIRTQNKNDIIQQGTLLVESTTAFSQVDAKTLFDYYNLNYQAKSDLKAQGVQYPNFYGSQFESKKLCAYDCITSFGQGVRVLNDNFKVPINGGPKGNMRVYLNNLANKGYAGAEQSISFSKDANGNQSMNGSMAGDMTSLANGEEGFHFFGVAINEGEHSVMTGVQIDATGNATNYYFMDNGGSTQTFSTQQELDDHITSWSNSLEAKDRPTYYRKLENTSQDAP